MQQQMSSPGLAQNTGLAQSLFGDDRQGADEGAMGSLLGGEPNREQDFGAIYQQPEPV